MKLFDVRGLAVFFVGFLMWTAFERGLFFDTDFFLLHCLMDVLGLLVILYLWFRGGLQKVAGALALWGVGVAYVLPLLFTRESVEATLEQVMRWTSYGVWGMLLIWFVRRQENRRTLRVLLPLVGFFLAVGMFAGFYGAFRFTDLYVVSQDARFTALGVRFSGFLQYANTFGAVMAAFLLDQLVALAKEKRREVALWLAGPLVLYGTAVLLSESRGAWLMLTVGWLVGFWVLTAEERWRYGLYSLLLGAAVLLVDGNFAQQYAAKAAYPGLAMVVAVTVVFVLLVRVLAKVRAQGWLYIGVSVLAVLAVVVSGAGMGELWQRGGQHFESAVARQLFYEDAWRMFQDSKWIGFGGESWRMLMAKYQQIPYVGNEVHSGLVSIALDVGLVGLVVFVAVLGRWLKRVVGQKAAVLPAIVVLLGHSLFDVDLSFGFVWLLVLAWMAVGMEQEESHRLFARQSWLRHVFAGGAMVLLMTSLVCAFHFEEGQIAYDRGDLKSAVLWNPFSATYRVELAQHLAKSTASQSQVLPLLQAGLRFEPHNTNLLLALADANWARDDAGQMVATFEETLQYDRYDNHVYEVYLQRLMQMAQQRWLQGRQQEATALAWQAVGVYQRNLQLAAQVQQSPLHVNDRHFATTPFVTYEAAQANALLLKFDEAESLLQKAAQAPGASPEVQRAATADLQELRLIVPKSYPEGFSLQTVYEEYLTWQQAAGSSF